jgi:hypothetical protein
LPNVNVGNSEKMRWCDEEVADWIRARFHRDFLAFGYDPARVPGEV